MWQALQQEIHALLGREYNITERQQLSQRAHQFGYRISDGKLPLFVKVRPIEDKDILVTEAFSLVELGRFGPLRVPEVIGLGQSPRYSFLLTEYLAIQPPGRFGWQRLGEGLAALHQRQDQAMYGFDEDNFIGDTPQRNGWHKHWHRFFSEQRLGYLLDTLASQQRPIADTDAVIAAASQLLKHHLPSPALLHGDLWRGNLGFVHDQPVIFDPACYYGDREADIAMTELFGRFEPDFYAAYDDALPLAEDYESRRSVYNLYHLLNHALIFADPFEEQAANAARHLLERVNNGA